MGKHSDRNKHLELQLRFSHAVQIECSDAIVEIMRVLNWD